MDQAQPNLSQYNSRVLSFLDSLTQLASGAIPTFLNGNEDNADAALAAGAIPEVNQVNVTYDANSNTTDFGFQLTSNGTYTGAYPEGTALIYSYGKTVIVNGWNQINTGWKWYENGAFKKEGWLKVEDNQKWYYFRGEWMQVGWQQINFKRQTDSQEKTYYFYFRPDIIQNTQIQTRGDMVNSWFEIEYEGSLQ